MSLKQVNPGKNVPDDINVIIEIPAHTGPIKYEVDAESGQLIVDRFMGTAMYYPCNYGFMPQTLAGDGDPVDVLVITPEPLLSTSLIRCRPVALLKMVDDGGQDDKVIAVPIDKVTPLYSHVQGPEDLPETLINAIGHFFTHYKDLDAGKWVKIGDWEDADSARQMILESAKRFKSEPTTVE